MPPLRNNNFINNLSSEINRPDPVRIFLVTLLVISLLVGSAFFTLGYFFETKSMEYSERIDQIASELDKMPLQDLKDFSKKVSTIEAIEKDRSNLLSFLAILSNSMERYTHFTSMSFIDKGPKTIVRLTGVSEDSYAEVVRHVDRLRDVKYGKIIKKVEVMGLSTEKEDDGKSVTFSLEIEIDSKAKLEKDLDDQGYEMTTSKKQDTQKQNTNTNSTPTQDRVIQVQIAPTTTAPLNNSTGTALNTKNL